MPPTPCENACSSVSNVASRTYKKEMLLQLWGSFRTSNWLWDAPRLPTQKRSQKGRLRNGETAWPGELKDTVFWPALGWSSMSNVASRTYKKEMLLQLWGSFRTSNWLWDAPRLPTQKRSQKGRLRNGETAWPGELKDTVFWPALGWSSMSNVASRTYKKEMLLQLQGLISHLELALRCTPTSDPKAFPKRQAPERGNSMAWRAQGHRFLTCVGVIFNVKRRVQNL